MTDVIYVSYSYLRSLENMSKICQYIEAFRPVIPCMSSFSEACILTGCLDDVATYSKERIYCVDCTWKQLQVVIFTVSHGVSLNASKKSNLTNSNWIAQIGNFIDNMQFARLSLCLQNVPKSIGLLTRPHVLSKYSLIWKKQGTMIEPRIQATTQLSEPRSLLPESNMHGQSR